MTSIYNTETAPDDPPHDVLSRMVQPVLPGRVQNPVLARRNIIFVPGLTPWGAHVLDYWLFSVFVCSAVSVSQSDRRTQRSFAAQGHKW